MNIGFFYGASTLCFIMKGTFFVKNSLLFATGQMFPLYCIENFFLKKKYFFFEKKRKKSRKTKKIRIFGVGKIKNKKLKDYERKYILAYNR